MDVSGSMAGEKLKQAKKALLFCIANLREGDRFEIIKFSTEAEALFGTLNSVTEKNKLLAEEFISSLRPIGGTNMDDAFALALKNKSSIKRPHNIVFITDGKPTIGETNEETLLKKINNYNHENSRVFTFGIGLEINTHLLDKLTENTRSYSSYISPEEDMEVKISSFFSKVNSPVLTDIEIAFGDGMKQYKVFPKQLPDLFKGTSITLFGRYKNNIKSTITVQGKMNDQVKKITYEVSPKNNITHHFIPTLWATRNIGYLLDQIRLHGENKELVDEVTSIALKYGIITPYTSYLILEDEKVEMANHNIAPRDGIFNDRFRSSADERIITEGYLREFNGMKNAKSGLPSVVSSVEIRNLSKAENKDAQYQGGARMEYVDKNGRQQNFARQSQNIQGRAIYQTNNAWIDSEVQRKNSTNARQIRFASDEYFSFLNDHPEVSPFLALGQNVKFVFDDQVFEIYQ